MKAFFVRRWFLIGLAVVLAIGFRFSRELEPASQAIPRNALVASVMFFMAFTLDARTMGRALRRPQAALVAIATNSAVAPLLAWAFSPLLRSDLGFGLIIAGSVPCTVASAAVWTRRAGGDDAVALLVAIVTNFMCFLVTPLWLLWAAGTAPEAGVSQGLDPIQMMTRLMLLVALPVLIAQLLRLIGPLGRWATKAKVPLGVYCQLGMLTMVFTGAVRSGVELRKLADQPDTPAATIAIDQQNPSPEVARNGAAPGEHQSEKNAPRAQPVGALGWALLLFCVLAVHLLAMAAGLGASRLLGISYPQQIAVAFSGSQKTLLIGLDIAVEYIGQFGGLALIPMVTYHVAQLLVDTVIADRFRVAGEATAAADEEAVTD